MIPLHLCTPFVVLALAWCVVLATLCSGLESVHRCSTVLTVSWRTCIRYGFDDQYVYHTSVLACESAWICERKVQGAELPAGTHPLPSVRASGSRCGPYLEVDRSCYDPG